MITRCMACRRGAPAWVLSFVQARSGDRHGDTLRRTALVLCEGCYRRASRAITEEYAAADWQLQRTAPVLRARDGSTRGRAAAAAISAAAPAETGVSRPWWTAVLSRLSPARS